MNKISLKSIIAPSFHEVHKDIKQDLHTHYWLKGGRGSTKSSFISIEIVLGIMKDASKNIMSNAVVFRRVKDVLRGNYIMKFFAVIAAVIGLVVAFCLAAWIKKADEGTDRMKEIAGYHPLWCRHPF